MTPTDAPLGEARTELGTVTPADLRAAFRGEVYGDAGSMTEAWFAAHVARNDVDLARSPRWTVRGALAGAALLAFREERAWVGGFGVAAEFRGRGLARRFLAETLAIARAAGATAVELEVIAHNAAAIALYERGGFVRIGELIAWTRDPLSPSAPHDAPAVSADAVRAHGARAYRTAEIAAIARDPATCWQREPRSVAAASPATLLLAGSADAPSFYAFVRRDDARAVVLDAGTRVFATSDAHAQATTSDAIAIVAELDRRFADVPLVLINEPPRGAFHDALAAAPAWRELARQWRMRAEL